MRASREGRNIDLLRLAISFYCDARFDNNSVRFFLVGVSNSALCTGYVEQDDKVFRFLQERCFNFKLKKGVVIRNPAVRKIHKETE